MLSNLAQCVSIVLHDGVAIELNDGVPWARLESIEPPHVCKGLLQVLVLEIII